MPLTGCGKLLSLALFMLLPTGLFAQADARQVALIPFWGPNAEIIAEFGEELLAAMQDLDGFDPEPVDMGNLPPDVPPGGFPPFVSPGPSMAGGRPFALTGETNYNAAESNWRLRLFLWDISDNRLLFTDEMAVLGRDVMAMIMPSMLDWLFSWVPVPTPPPPPEPPPPPPPPPAPPPVVAVEAQQVVVYQGAAANVHHWVYFGVRAGGNLQMFRPLWPELRVDDSFDLQWENVSAAASLNFQFLRFLGLQFEGVALMDFAHDDMVVSFMFPALLRLTARRGTSSLSLLGGPYFFWSPEGQGIQFNYMDELPWGFTAGFNIGNRFGPVYIFMEARWFYDMFGNYRAMDFDHRNTVNVSLGFELGLFRRRR